MTFSLLGRCSRTGRLGMVVSSSSPAVAARCAHPRPGVGIAASQNVTDPRLGPALLDALAREGDAARAVDEVAAAAPHAEYRQLALLGRLGPPAAFTGTAALGLHGHRLGEDCAAAGNLLASETVLDAMVDRFEALADADLGDRLLAALAVGREAGPVRSAGLLIIADVEWPVADLRVDWADAPVAALQELWAVYRPQLEEYVTRALDPAAAPGFGVPGERAPTKLGPEPL
jgi:uncharacterized Ntn-hydrolase superfamily protein